MKYSMYYKGIVITTSLSPPSPPPSSSSSSSPDSPPLDLQPAAVTLSPSSSLAAVYPPEMVAAISYCGPCNHVGRICTENCVLAAYFPPNDLLKLTTVDRVFGASNIIKMLQELPESQRADAVSSMVYEANARLRDPVYGCAGAIYHLQNQVSDLQAQFAKAQAEVVIMQCQQANLIQRLCMERGQSPQALSPPQQSLENSVRIPMDMTIKDQSALSERKLK